MRQGCVFDIDRPVCRGYAWRIDVTLPSRPENTSEIQNVRGRFRYGGQRSALFAYDYLGHALTRVKDFLSIGVEEADMQG